MAIGIMQVGAAPYRDETFAKCEEECGFRLVVSTFPDGMDTHPEWKYKSVKEDYVAGPAHMYSILGRKMPYNPDVRKWIRQYTWDGLVLEGYNSLTNLYAIGYAVRHKIPIVMAMDTVTDPGHTSAKKMLHTKIGAYWVPGNRTRNFLLRQGIPAEKIFGGKYTYNYKTLYQTVKQADRKQLREKLGISEDATVGLFVGKLIPSRKIGALLQALEAVDDPEFRMILIGDGPEQQKVLECGDPRIIHIPSVPLADLYSYYAVSDLYVHPGEEPYSLALVQAVVAELVVVSSDGVGASDDVIREGENGYVFPNGDVSGLKNALAASVKNLAVLKAGAEKMSRFIREKRSIEAAARELSAAIAYAQGRVDAQGTVRDSYWSEP